MSLKLPRVNCTDDGKCLSCPINVNAFPGKLWKLVNDANYQSIQWSSCGTTIVVDAHHFKEEVLRTGEYSIFKTQNFSSFVRQLNLYGFRKIATTASAKYAEYRSSMKRGSYSNPLHCFAHNFFLQHRPDLLARVRRTSSTNKRRPGFDQGQGQGDAAYYGQYGNTFRILGRCGQNTTPSFITTAAAQTTIPPRAGATPSYVFPSSLTIASPAQAQQNFLHTIKPGHVPSYVSDSESDCSDADDLAEESSALLKKSSAKVLWGQGQKYTHVQGDTSSESSQNSQSSFKLSSKPEKGSFEAGRLPEEVVPFPSGLYDARGRLQKFMVVQQSPKLGVPPRTFSQSPSSDHPSSTLKTSPTFWSPVLGSSRCAMPFGVDSEFCGYQQVLDQSSAQSPYLTAYPSAPYMPYGPTTAVPPENMMSMAYYPGSPAFSSPHFNYASPPPSCSHGDEDDEDDEDDDVDPRDKFKKVVVKQQLKEVPRTYSALVEEEGEESPSPQQAAQRRFVWNNCDNERDKAEMYVKNSQPQFHYSTEG